MNDLSAAFKSLSVDNKMAQSWDYIAVRLPTFLSFPRCF